MRMHEYICVLNVVQIKVYAYTITGLVWFRRGSARGSVYCAATDRARV